MRRTARNTIFLTFWTENTPQHCVVDVMWPEKRTIIITACQKTFRSLIRPFRSTRREGFRASDVFDKRTNTHMHTERITKKEHLNIEIPCVTRSLGRIGVITFEPNAPPAMWVDLNEDVWSDECVVRATSAAKPAASASIMHLNSVAEGCASHLTNADAANDAQSVMRTHAQSLSRFAVASILQCCCYQQNRNKHTNLLGTSTLTVKFFNKSEKNCVVS